MKNPGKVRARTYGTKSPSRSEALRFIDSAKSPTTKIDGSLMNFRRSLPCPLDSLRLKFTNEPPIFDDGDLAQCFRSAGWFGAVGSSPDFSRVFLFSCTTMSYPGQLFPFQTCFCLWWLLKNLNSMKQGAFFSFWVSKVITTVHSHKVSFFFVGPSRELLLRPWLDHYK